MNGNIDRYGRNDPDTEARGHLEEGRAQHLAAAHYSDSSIVRPLPTRGPAGSCLEQMLERQPHMLVSVALANKMARLVWALLTRQVDDRAPAAAAA